LVEGDKLRAEVSRVERLTRFNYDAPLIAAFMDRWRLETHMFHLPVGEMTFSLEDAAIFRTQALLGRIPDQEGPLSQALASLSAHAEQKRHHSVVFRHLGAPPRSLSLIWDPTRSTHCMHQIDP
jgi:hypothetical protein